MILGWESRVVRYGGAMEEYSGTLKDLLDEFGWEDILYGMG